MANLITLLPVSQVQSTPPVAQGGASQAGVVLSTVPAGSVLQGFIVNRDSSGNPIVRTDKGDIAFTTNFFLKIGSEVVIRVGTSGGNPLAHLLSVDGQPPEAAEHASGFSQPEVILGRQFAAPGSTAANTSAARSVAISTTGQPVITVTGTVISTPPGVATPRVPAGTQLLLNIVSLTLPATVQAAPGIASTSAAQVNSAFYATYAKAAGTSSTPGETTGDANITQTSTVKPPAETKRSFPLAPQASETIALQQQVAASGTHRAVPLQTPTLIVASDVEAAIKAPLAIPPAPPGHTSSPVSTPATDTPVPAGSPIASSPAAPVANFAITPVFTAVENALLTQPALQRGDSLLAQVIGNEPTGEAVVQSPIGIVRLQVGTVIPTGSGITFELAQAIPLFAQDIGGSVATAIQPAPLTELAQQWISLQQIFGLLSGRSTLTGLDDQLTVTASLYNNNPLRVPLSGEQISSSLLLFLSAIRGGDSFRSWLGDSNVSFLESQGHGDLFKKAQAEFNEISRQFTQAAPNHWQPLFFPVAVEGMLHQVRMFLKRDRKQGTDQERTKEEDTRFVIEMDLSQLGEIQMDGFVRKQEQQVHFDMVIRSVHALPETFQQDILRIYNDMGAITGYSGSVSFQSVREFPVNPMEDIVATRDMIII